VTLFRALATWAVGVALLWAAGLAWFVESVPPADPATAPTDAVVALTGGSLRLETGFALLRDGKAKALFISGVNPRVSLVDLLHVSGAIPEWAFCCTTLGHEAESTLGNAIETAGWVEAHGYKSLRLVTAWYHMPRSLLEFERAMPAVAITPHPVFPEGIGRGSWWRTAAGAGLVIGEYDKYLAALLRPLALTLQQRILGAPPHNAGTPR
jgi:uncharacterized SAM-binding protein YcdF (DUF218 family)